MTDIELAAQSLCKACGLCCDGTLFDKTNLSREDDRKALESGVFGDCQDQQSLPQPCPGLSEGVCTLYECRPRACRTYKCNPLKQFINSNTSYKDTLQTITKYRAQVDRAQNAILSATSNDSVSPREQKLAEFEHNILQLLRLSIRKRFNKKDD